MRQTSIIFFVLLLLTLSGCARDGSRGPRGAQGETGLNGLPAPDHSHVMVDLMARVAQLELQVADLDKKKKDKTDE